MTDVINLADKFARFDEYWSPHIAGEKFRDREVWVDEGEFIIVPRGVEHKPVAEEECHVLLLEPKTTLNTGNVKNGRTVSQLKRV
jgi:hypothetical protein